MKTLCLRIAAFAAATLLSWMPPAAAGGVVAITTVIDNESGNSELATAWGFAAAIVTPEGSTLFDAGPSGDKLLANMTALGLTPGQFGAIVISHDHDDHFIGLKALLRENPAMKIYLPGQPIALPRLLAAVGVTGIKVRAPREIAPGIRSTGPVDQLTEEQALIVETAEGLVVLTGCAHPGIVKILETVKSLNPGKRLLLVMGGFHLFESPVEAIGEVVQEFKRLAVEKVTPSHCSGDYARQLFKQEFGTNYIAAGVGFTVDFPAAP